jgi:hypothetical protein
VVSETRGVLSIGNMMRSRNNRKKRTGIVTKNREGGECKYNIFIHVKIYPQVEFYVVVCISDR